MAWVREAPPNAEVSAEYLTIHNPDEQAHVLAGVSSPQFLIVQIHRTSLMAGHVHMQLVTEVNVAAHGNVEFKPGEYHLMLMEPLRSLKAGDTVTLRLKFKNASQITVQAPVRNGEEGDESPHDHPMKDTKMQTYRQRLSLNGRGCSVLTCDRHTPPIWR